MDSGRAAIGLASGNRDLELSWHMLHQRIAQQAPRNSVGHYTGVHMLPGACPGQLAGGHVAKGIAAGLPRGQPRRIQVLEKVWSTRKGNKIELKILPCGNVGLTLGIFPVDGGNGAQPFRGKNASRQLDAYHLDAGL